MKQIGQEVKVKHSAKIVGVALAVGIGLIGCSKRGGVDTGKLESSFQTAEQALKTEADKAVAAIKAGNYEQALAELQNLAKKAKLTAEQQQAIKDTIAAIEKLMTEMAEKAASDAEKAAGDIKKSLGK